MKHIFKNTAVGFVAALGLLACQEFDIDTQSVPAINFVTDASDSYYLMGENAEAISFKVSSNIPWKIASNQAWCQVDPKISSAVGLIADISVTCEDSDNKEEERTALVTIEVEGMETDTIRIVQAAQANMVVVPSKTEMVALEGGRVTYSVKSNKAWTARVAESDATWVRLDVTQGEASNEVVEVTATVDPNKGLGRTAAIVFENGIVEPLSFVLQQDGTKLGFEGIEAADKLIASGGERKSFQVDFNLEWEAICDDARVQLIAVSATQLDVVFPTNNIFISKNYTLTLQPKENADASMQATLDLTQEVDYWWNGSSDAGAIREIDPTTGALTLGSPAGQVSQMLSSSYRGLGTYTLTFENPSFGGGSYFRFQGSFSSSNSEVGNANYVIDIESGQVWMQTGGTVNGEGGFWNQVIEPLDSDPLNSLTELKVAILPKAGDNTMMTIEVFVNGTSRAILETKNMWQDTTTPGFEQIMGFRELAAGANGLITIKSYDVEPYIAQ